MSLKVFHLTLFLLAIGAALHQSEAQSKCKLQTRPLVKYWYHLLGDVLQNFYENFKETKDIDFNSLGVNPTLMPCWVNHMEEAQQLAEKLQQKYSTIHYENLPFHIKEHLAEFVEPSEFKTEDGREKVAYLISGYATDLGKQLFKEGLKVLTAFSYIEIQTGQAIWGNVSQATNLLDEYKSDIPQINRKFKDINSKLQQIVELIKFDNEAEALTEVRNLRDDYRELNGTIRGLQVRINNNIMDLRNDKTQYESDAKMAAVIFAVALTTLAMYPAAYPTAILVTKGTAVIAGVWTVASVRNCMLTDRDIFRMRKLYDQIKPFEERAEEIYHMLVAAEKWHYTKYAEMEKRAKFYRNTIRKRNEL